MIISDDFFGQNVNKIFQTAIISFFFLKKTEIISLGEQ